MAVKPKSMLETVIRNGQRVNDLIDMFPDAMVLMREDLIVIGANQAVATLLELPLSALPESTPVKEFLARIARHAEFDDMPVRDALQKALTAMNKPKAAVSLGNFTYNNRYLTWWVAPGPADTVALMFRNISERYQLMQDLNAQKAFLQHFIDAMPAPLYFKNIDGAYRRVNGGFADFVGRTQDELIGNTAEQVLPEDLAAAINALEEPLMKEQGQTSNEISFDGPDGLRHALVNTATLMTPSGQVGGVFGALIDISDQKKAQEEVAQAASRLRVILDKSPVGVAISNRKSSDFMFHNPRFVELLGGDLLESEDVAFNDTLLISERFRKGMLRELDAEQVLVDSELRIKIGSADARWFLTTIEQITFEGEEAILWWIRDITKQKLLAQELKQKASFDALTGLANRARFTQRMERAERLIRGTSRTGAVMLLDLDGFKAVNDTLGHECGDFVLKEVSKRLQRAVRGADVIARLGGDEFTVLFTSKGSHQEMEEVANTIIEAITEEMDWNGTPCRVGTSIGISLFDGGIRDAAEELKRADTAMYEAKNAGKGQYRFATHEEPD